MQNANIFRSDELDLLRFNVNMMQVDIRIRYQQTVDESHYGRPDVVTTVHTSKPGRPSIHIDPEFLRWAYSQRSIAAISRFLNVGRSVVRNALLAYGIVQSQQNPFPQAEPVSINTPDDLLDPLAPQPQDNLEAADPVLSDTAAISNRDMVSFTGPLSTLSDGELDQLIGLLRKHYPRAGLSMLDGMLRQLGQHVPRERIRHSLYRIDPVQRVFQRIRIRRRKYSVPGPNSLWHHDGQHGELVISQNRWRSFLNVLLGLIRWGIVIHGFIDGYSRLITGLRASDNNMAATVLDVFLAAVRVYMVPLRLRGDHGVENLDVAIWMEGMRGQGRGSYIWGRQVVRSIATV
jgi:hypothetical protein